MSDEEGNYDDFMMSDDGEVESIEMEEDSDVEVEKSDGLQGVEIPGAVELSVEVERLYDAGKSFKEDQEFEAAREDLRKVREAGISTSLSFKAQKQVLKCWFLEITYDGLTPNRRVGLINDLKILRGLIELTVLQNESAVKSMERLLERLVPSITSSFLFDEKPSVDSEGLAFRLEILEEFKFLTAPYPSLGELVEFKILETTVWITRLSSGVVSDDLVYQLKSLCKGNFDALSILLQCYILRFLHGNSIDVGEIQLCISELQNLFSKAFSLAQHPRVLAAVHFSQCIVAMNEDSYQGHARRINECKDGFWGCFKSLEEIGIAKSHDNSYFRDLTLTGFVLADMIILCNEISDKDEITPFELEQIKIVETAPLVQDLKQVYDNFKLFDLNNFALSMNKLSRFRNQLRPLFTDVYQLVRVQKLWNHIAKLYTCISLSDIQKELKIGDRMEMTRNDLLTVLMKSIMNDTAKIYFKLDLTQDLVYFGDEYRTHFSAFTKEHYLAHRAVEQELGRAKTPRQRLGADPTLYQEAVGARIDKEWVDNVGVFDTPKRFKGVNAVQLMDELQLLRESKNQEDASSQRRETKLPELLSLVMESLG